ncbi:MAG: stage III sporulation protein AC [Clostridia bacterium]|nr:stage III sporulation protein AC [Clostridia bacterium]
MDISLILKITGIGLIVAVACQILEKSGRNEQAVLLSVGGIVIVFIMIIGQIGNLLTMVKNTFGL